MVLTVKNPAMVCVMVCPAAVFLRILRYVFPALEKNVDLFPILNYQVVLCETARGVPLAA